MLKQLTRSKVIVIWFSAVALVVVSLIAFGVAMTIGTGALLVMMLWPTGGPPTVAEVLHDAQGRE